MSRQNKVNPGMYTQRGRLTQDDAARELRKQSAIRSPHTWQPANIRRTPWPAPAGAAARDTDTSADNEAMAETPRPVKRRSASRVTRKMTAAAKAKTSSTRKSKRTTGKAKTSRAMTTARKQTRKPTRKAVARKVGGRGAARRLTTKRRKS